MGYIKKLKNNELVGGTDKHTIYPVTSTKAVFEEVTEGDKSSFKSQETINGEHDDRIKGLENEMPDTVKSITINGGTKTYLPEDGNVNLTVYTPGGEDYPGIAEAVQENSANIEIIQNEIGTDTTENSLSGRITSLETTVGEGGSIDQRIENNINSLDSKLSADIDNLSEYVESIYQTKIISVDTKPETGEAGMVYRVPNAGGITYSDWMYNEDSQTWIELATFDVSALDSSNISYDNTQSELDADNIQDAIDELSNTLNGEDETKTHDFAVDGGLDDGYYIKSQNNLVIKEQVAGAKAYYATLKAGDVVTVVLHDNNNVYSAYIGVISKKVGTSYTRLVQSVKENVASKTYTYTVQQSDCDSEGNCEIWVSTRYYTASDTFTFVTTQHVEGIAEKVEDLSSADGISQNDTKLQSGSENVQGAINFIGGKINGKTEDVTTTQVLTDDDKNLNKRIVKSNGVEQNFTGAFYSKPIQVQTGDVVRVSFGEPTVNNTNAGTTGIFAYTNQNGSSRSGMVAGVGNTSNYGPWTMANDGYITVCNTSSTDNDRVLITRSVTTKSYDERIETLEESKSGSNACMNVEALGNVDCEGFGMEGFSHIILYGQSLSIGSLTWVPLTGVVTDTRDDVLMLGDKPTAAYVNPENPSTYNAFTPMQCKDPYPEDESGGRAEPPIAQACYALKAMLDRTPYRNTKIVGTSCGTGSTTIDTLINDGWYKHFRGTVLNAKANADAANLPINCPAIVWMQGEFDQANPPATPVAAYKQKLLTLKNNMQSYVMEHYRQKYPPLFFCYQTSGWSDIAVLSEQQAVRELSQEYPDFIVMNPHYGLPQPTGHFSSNGSRWFGEYIAKSIYYALIKEIRQTAVVPRRFELNDEKTELRIHCIVPNPPLVIDTYFKKIIGGNEAQIPNYGFAIYKNGSAIVIRSVEIVGDTTILLTFAPLGSYTTLEVEYAGIASSNLGCIRDSDDYMTTSKMLDPETYYTSEATQCGGWTGDSKAAYRQTFIDADLGIKDENGNNYVGRRYPMHNWLQIFRESI